MFPNPQASMSKPDSGMSEEKKDASIIQCMKTNNSKKSNDAPSLVVTNPVVNVETIHLNGVTIFLKQTQE
jgi:hypothetical protein